MASATGFAPLGAWPVTLICFAWLLYCVKHAPNMKRALLSGWLFGVGHFTLGLNWIAHAFTFQDAMPHGFGYGAVALLSLYLAVFPAVTAGLAWRWGTDAGSFSHHPRESGDPASSSSGNFAEKRDSRFRGNDGVIYTLFFAAAWIVTEWLRATLFTGFAWNPLGVVFVDFGFMARTVGTYGLSAWVIGASGLLMFGFAPWIRGIREHWADGTWLTYAIGPVLIATACIAVYSSQLVDFGTARDPDSYGQNAHRPALRVVQPNIGQETKYDPAQDAANFRKLAHLSGLPGKEPRLLLWPEAAVPEYLDEDRPARWRMADLLGPNDILLTGGTKRYRKREVRGAYIEEYTIGGRNSLFAMDARGTLLHRYDKAHLVPYGEYLPMRPFLSAIGLSRLVPGDIDFWPGPGPQSYALPGFGKVGVQICYEIIFSGQVVDRANRPDFLFNPSNDAWFGSWGPPQHLAQARLRAIEEGIPVIRSTPTGISAVVDADGRIIESLPFETAGFIDARLPAPHSPTLFARFGNILPLAFAIFLAGLGVAMRRRAR
ncbi:apolipoprotein N-acyltransferase [Sphingobium boeckii]|uniref:Apolipoprotein N-acyltransferase n=1 Tax=Sphingobium boeckii TaxID=1082345 RepID=A0A7W9EEP0_9SPHN|nr:apolipoprotein N-acyltransferase [Sphingobium boeckii]MBB5686239.1 apolipoprotein N-acyltransferase [Sphingobium boeckii]